MHFYQLHFTASFFPYLYVSIWYGRVSISIFILCCQAGLFTANSSPGFVFSETSYGPSEGLDTMNKTDDDGSQT